MDYRKGLSIEDKYDFMLRDIRGLKNLIEQGKIGTDATSMRRVKEILSSMLSKAGK